MYQLERRSTRQIESLFSYHIEVREKDRQRVTLPYIYTERISWNETLEMRMRAANAVHFACSHAVSQLEFLECI